MTADGPDRRDQAFAYALCALFALLAGANLAYHADFPVVRNSLIYARIVDSLLEFGFDFSVAEHGFNKALGFPILSLPAAAVFGTSPGLKISAFVSSALWLGSVAFFFGHLKRAFAWEGALPPRSTLCLALFFVNPLVFYQFLSAYPDSLNALAMLWALYFLDRMTSRDPHVSDGVSFFALLIAAIWIKHHGFVLFGVLLVFAVCRYPNLAWQARNRRRAWFASLLSLGVAALIVGSAQAGWIPIFNLAQNRSNYGSGVSNLGSVLQTNLRFLFDYLLVSFGVLIPLLLRWKSLSKFKEWYLTLLLFVATILVYKGASGNIRYYLPIAPLLVWILASNLMRIDRRLAIALVAVFGLTHAFTTAYYNNPAFHFRFNEAIELPVRDNLRMIQEQYYRHLDIQAINAQVSPQRNVLFFSLRYYDGGGLYVWERAGLFSPDLRIEYMKAPNWRYIVDYAKEHQLEQALYYAGSGVGAVKHWRSDVRIQRISTRSYALTFH